MMQTNEIRQRFRQIEQTIQQAAAACAHAQGVPMDVKDCVQQMDQRSHQVMQEMQTADQTRITQCIDELEQMGDEARDACERAGNVNEELHDAVMQAHDELSQLKRQLH
ncbi:hypothetical protein [Lacisediminimonas sp.]|uniref:hypothetical protein n=1 Tax=Lacisediminimonas sp. TaxID=3060582 RepID=UPI0027167A39|nr:hypothetical protein [Lacisediminimonas sp.]MDO8299583.1 hypothetical protein [Lacisediminimonas sp.]